VFLTASGALLLLGAACSSSPSNETEAGVPDASEDGREAGDAKAPGPLDAATDAFDSGGNAGDGAIVASADGGDATIPLPDGDLDAPSADAPNDATEEGATDAPTDAPPAVCGDGLRNTSAEECDDGPANGGVTGACSAQCTVQDFLATPPTPDAGSGPLSSPPRVLGAGRHPLATSAGGFAVSFLEEGDSAVALRAEAFDPTGARLASFAAIGDPGRTTATSDPVLAAVSATGYALVWTDQDPDGTSGVAMSLLDTAKASVAPVVHTGSPGAGSADAVWTGSSLVVAWVDSSNAATAPDLMVQTFDATLSPREDAAPLAATGDAESEVALAPFAGGWAAAWHVAGADGDAIHVRAGSTEFTVGPFTPDPDGARPTLAPLGATTLLVAFDATVPADDAGTVTTVLEGAVIDVTAGAKAVTPTLFEVPAGSALAQSSATAVSEGTDGAAWLASWTAGAPGDPLGEELWLAPVTGGALGTAGGAAFPLPRQRAHRAGDQRTPALATLSAGGSIALVLAWEDYGGAMSVAEALPDVVLQVMPLPGVRVGPDRVRRN
jgi:hypothetical protein